MTIAIGGWLLLVTSGVAGCIRDTVSCAVQHGTIVRGYDTARECESARTTGQICVPALALVNR